TTGFVQRARSWLVGVPAPDPVARRHAPSVLVLCGLGSTALLVGELVRWEEGALRHDLAVSLLRLAGAVVLGSAFVLVRGGRFKAGVSLFVTGAVLISAAGVALTGFAANSRNLTELTMPLALAALLVGRRALWTAMAAYAAGFAIGGLRDEGLLWSAGPHTPPTLPFGTVGTAIIAFTVVSIVLDRVGLSLREGFDLALARQHELERTFAELAEVNTALKAEMARRQAAEAQLIEAQKMEAVSRLSGGVAHDFNNLLTVILGCAQISKETLPSAHPAQESLDGIREAAERAADLTRQLLAFARRQLVEPKVLQLDERVRSTQKLLGRLLGENIQLQTELSTTGWDVLIDPGQLDQVIVNFAVNARDAMPAGGKLTIRTREVSLEQGKASALFSLSPGQYVVLEVVDQGTGMDPETARRVFEPFFTTKGGTKGTGLGLATCYGIVLQAGGAIFVETELGQGTKFEVYLPRSRRAGDAGLGASMSAAGSSAGRGETVLVVEDEASVLLVTKRVLEQAGYRVLSASSLVQALAVARSTPGPIDLLVTDLVLPDGGGRDVAERVAELRPEIRVLYVSGYTDDPALRRGISESEIEFLGKPFAPDRLVARVREVLDRPEPRRARSVHPN
ncbi:MAG TPA: ATP-binding protein, partial [Polyangiaceae bacterium]|nr:ATP-binding protein [Polyangiaceae bacterium]